MAAWLAVSVALTLAPGPVASPGLTAVLAHYGPDAEQELLELAQSGTPGAQAFLDGLAQIKAHDVPAACRAWETGADVSAEAAHFAAECYEHGYGGAPQDTARAIALYTAAGDGGYAKSLCALGNLYAAGTGLTADPARAIALCRRGADMGDPDAQTDLGNYYLTGEGVAEDHAEAFRLYTLAAAQNQRNAAFVLGQMYWNADTVAKDNDEAARLWTIAWEGGRTDAALLLARAAMVRAMLDRAHPNADALRDSEHWFVLAIPEITDPAAKTEAEGHLALVRRILAGPTPQNPAS